LIQPAKVDAQCVRENTTSIEIRRRYRCGRFLFGKQISVLFLRFLNRALDFSDLAVRERHRRYRLPDAVPVRNAGDSQLTALLLEEKFFPMSLARLRAQGRKWLPAERQDAATSR
jgi:hypothetical protein